MKLYVITAPDFIKNEVEAITTLFDNGLEILHFRKLNATPQKCKQILREIPDNYRAKIVIHGYSQLVTELQLKGLHSATEPRITGKSLSRSCHSFAEIATSLGKYDYLFISSIFDSISKPSLGATFTIKDIETAVAAKILTKQVVALGGINLDAIKTLAHLGFKNAAILGYLWNTYEKNHNDIKSLIDGYLSIKNECQKYA